MTDYILDPCIFSGRTPNPNNEKRCNGWVCSDITDVINCINIIVSSTFFRANQLVNTRLRFTNIKNFVFGNFPMKNAREKTAVEVNLSPDSLFCAWFPDLENSRRRRDVQLRRRSWRHSIVEEQRIIVVIWSDDKKVDSSQRRAAKRH